MYKTSRARQLDLVQEISMPTYYFHLQDDQRITDPDGTDLPNIGSARDHAAGVARELTTNSHGILGEGWSDWTMSVCDGQGTELFSFPMNNSTNDNSAK
jgi:hypothetical protein